MDIDKFHIMLEEIVNDIPEKYLVYLNGGFLLLPEERPHDIYPSSVILGTYNNYPNRLGRFVIIYYGSFIRKYGINAPEEVFRNKLRDTVLHELLHHVESLAKTNDLAKQEQRELFEYIQKHKKKKD